MIAAAMSMVLPELFAAGTPAGTVIQTRSRVVYSSQSGTKLDTVFSAAVDIIVAQRAAFNIIPKSGASATASDSTTAEYAIVLMNSGNGTDGARISSVSSNGWKTAVYADANGDGILQTAEISAGTVTQTTAIAADAQFALIARIQVPRGETLNGMADTATVIVKSEFDSTKSNTGSYITTVRMTGLNAVSPGLTVDNASPAAGQQVTYTFTLTNNGSVAAESLNVSNLIPNGLTLVSGNSTSGIFLSGLPTATWKVGTLAPSQTATFTLTLLVNMENIPGKVIPNQFIVTYVVGSNAYTLLSNSRSLTVSGVLQYGVSISSLQSPVTKEAGDTAAYGFIVRNAGAFRDLIELSVSSNLGLPWKLYQDGNANHAWDKSDPLVLNTNDSAGVDLDSLSVGDSVHIFAVASVPKLESDQMKDTVRMTALSARDHSKFEHAGTVTTILSPVVTLSKSVFPAGNQPAGSVITYTVTYANAGSVAVKNFAVIDATPQQTNYIPNSVKLNGVAVADNSGSVTIIPGLNQNTIVTVSIGALSAQSNGSIEFKVKIK